MICTPFSPRTNAAPKKTAGTKMIRKKKKRAHPVTLYFGGAIVFSFCFEMESTINSPIIESIIRFEWSDYRYKQWHFCFEPTKNIPYFGCRDQPGLSN